MLFTRPSFLFGGLVGGLGLRLMIHMVYLLSKQTMLAAIGTVDNVDRKIFAKLNAQKFFYGKRLEHVHATKIKRTNISYAKKKLRENFPIYGTIIWLYLHMLDSNSTNRSLL